MQYYLNVGSAVTAQNDEFWCTFYEWERSFHSLHLGLFDLGKWPTNLILNPKHFSRHFQVLRFYIEDIVANRDRTLSTLCGVLITRHFATSYKCYDFTSRTLSKRLSNTYLFIQESEFYTVSWGPLRLQKTENLEKQPPPVSDFLQSQRFIPEDKRIMSDHAWQWWWAQ